MRKLFNKIITHKIFAVCSVIALILPLILLYRFSAPVTNSESSVDSASSEATVPIVQPESSTAPIIDPIVIRHEIDNIVSAWRTKEGDKSLRKRGF